MTKRISSSPLYLLAAIAIPLMILWSFFYLASPAEAIPATSSATHHGVQGLGLDSSSFWTKVGSRWGTAVIQGSNCLLGNCLKGNNAGLRQDPVHFDAGVYEFSFYAKSNFSGGGWGPHAEAYIQYYDYGLGRWLVPMNVAVPMDDIYRKYTVVYTFTNDVPLAAFDIGVGTRNAWTWIDNIEIKRIGDSLLERTAISCVANDAKEYCQHKTAKGSAANGTVDTKTGGVNHIENHNSVPVAGDMLTFQTNYASRRADIHRDGYPEGDIGDGWVHNYQMRLELDDNQTELAGTIEFQTSDGNYLPFYDNGDGTYDPYPGVAGELVQNLDGSFTLTESDQSTLNFDASGRLESKLDAHINAIAFSYYGSGHPSDGKLYRVRQGDRYLEYTYYTSGANIGQLNTVADNAGRTTTISYDTNSRLSSVTNPNNETMSYQYDAVHGYLEAVVDPTSKTLREFVYDASGRAIQVKDGHGNIVSSIDYTNPDEPVVTEGGATLTHVYGDRGTLEEMRYTCPDGVSTCTASTSHDDSFRNGQVTDSNGNTTILNWDDAGSHLTGMTNALGDSTSFSYDSFNNLTQMVDAQLNTTSYFYENTFFPTFQTRMVDALGGTTVYTPTAKGFIAFKENEIGLLTHYQYNSYGQLIQTTSAYGTPEATSMQYAYDEIGRLITTTNSFGLVTVNTYDNVGRLTQVTRNYLEGAPQNHQDLYNLITAYGYDAAGRQISVTDTLGRVNRTVYDAAGRVSKRIQNYDGVTDLNTLCTDTYYANPDPEFNICSVTEYDSLGRVSATRDSLGDRHRTFYDAQGRVLGTVRNSVQIISAAQLDSCFALPLERDHDLCTKNEYDPMGNLIISTDAQSRQSRTFYDELNRSMLTVRNWTGTIQGEADFNLCFGSHGTDNDENVCSFTEYDSLGNTIIVTDTVGRMNRSYYDELNRLVASVTNWNPATLQSPDDCLISSTNTDEENICTLYGYNAAGNQITTTNALGQTSLTIFDEANRVVGSVQNWSGTDPQTLLTTCHTLAADRDEDICSFTEYNSFGRRSASIDTMGERTEYGYDAMGRVITTTRTLNGLPVETVTLYDAAGRTSGTVDALGNTSTSNFDSLDRVVSSVSASGVVVTRTYDAASRVVNTINSLGHTTSNEYDGMGRVVTRTNALNEQTISVYTVDGQLQATIDGEGTRTEYVYDDLGRQVQQIQNVDGTGIPTNDANVTTTTVYDVLGNRIEVINGLGNVQFHTDYDTLNRPIAVRNAYITSTTTTAYNALGHRTVMTDANGRLTTYTYDGLNRVDAIFYATDNETVDYTYNPRGQQTEMSDAVGTTVYGYDAWGRMENATSPYFDTVGYTYDLNGNRETLTYPDGKVVTYTYDADNRLATLTDWSLGVFTFEYDNAGRHITTTLSNGVVAVNVYDDAGRLEERSYTAADATLLGRYEYEYNAISQQTTVTETVLSPEIVTQIEAFFEENGDLILEAEDGQTAAGTTHNWVTQTVQSGYVGSSYMQSLPDNGTVAAPGDPASPVLTFPIFITTPTTYRVWARGLAADDAGDSLHITLEDNNADTATNMTGFSDSAWSWESETISATQATLPLTESGLYTLTVSMSEDGFQLDRLWLISDTLTTPSGSGPAASVMQTQTVTLQPVIQQTVTYAYDGLDRLAQATYVGTLDAVYSYDYDEVGNRTHFTETVTSGAASVQASHVYTYDVANRLLFSTELTSGDTTTFTYNLKGELTWKTLPSVSPTDGGGFVNDSQSYTYDQRGRLKKVDEFTGDMVIELASYVYDGANRRLQQITSNLSVINSYVYDYARGGQRVLFESNGQETKHYIYGGACLGEFVTDTQTQDTQWRHYLYDGNGYVRQTVDEQAEPTFAWTFSPDGAVAVGEEGPVTHLMCDGDAAYDWATGLIYKNGRYFDPRTHIWLSAGAIGIVLSSQRRRPNRFQRRLQRKLGKYYPQVNRGILLLLIIVSVTILIGCGGGSTTTPTPQPTATCTPTFEAAIPPTATSIPEEVTGGLQGTPPPPATITPEATITPFAPLESKIVFFAGSQGDGVDEITGVRNIELAGPARDTQTPVWDPLADYWYQYPGYSGNSGNLNGKNWHAEIAMADFDQLKNFNLLVIGYSAGADSALIFAQKYYEKIDDQKAPGNITGLALLGPTLSNPTVEQADRNYFDLANRWRSTMDDLLFKRGSDIYVLNDSGPAGNSFSSAGYTAPSNAKGRLNHVIRDNVYDGNTTTQQHITYEHLNPNWATNGTNNSQEFAQEVVDWFNSN